MSTTTTQVTTAPDRERVQEFAGQLFGTLSAGATALMISIGHRTGLFDRMAGSPPSTSALENNLDIPWAPFLYTVSTMHCMTVSLALDGDGLGTVWGVETAQRMLAEAGFSDVTVTDVPEDFINAYYVAKREPIGRDDQRKNG